MASADHSDFRTMWIAKGSAAQFGKEIATKVADSLEKMGIPTEQWDQLLTDTLSMIRTALASYFDEVHGTRAGDAEES